LDFRLIIDYCISPPQYDLPGLRGRQRTPQYDLPALSRYFHGNLRGPDSGISATVTADKFVSLRQAGLTEMGSVMSRTGLKEDVVRP